MDLKMLQDIPPWDWPEGASRTLQEILRNHEADASERLLAAELAGDFSVTSDELLEILLSIVQSSKEPEKLRARAVISLGPALEYADEDIFDEDFDEATITEGMFNKIQDSLQRLYRDAGVPKEVRRRILEASVRAPEEWHRNAVSAAYQQEDEDWKLTAVFCMRFIRGFEDQIVESLESKNPNIHYQAVCAAGIWEVDAAWPHITGLIASAETEKSLLLAAIESTAFIRPQEASEILGDLLEAEDEDIVDAVYETLSMAVEDWEGEMDEDEVLH